MCYLHPSLGNRDPSVVSDVHKVPARTVQNWISSKSMIPKWLSFAKPLTTQDILSSVPRKFQDTHVDRHKTSMVTPFEISMKSMKSCCCEEKAPKGKKHVAYDTKDKGSGQRLPEDKNFTSDHEKRKVDCYRMRKYQRAKDCMSSQVSASWREGKFFFALAIIILLI